MMKKNMLTLVAPWLLFVALVFPSCDSLIYDDPSDCPRGLYVKLYSQTECAEQRSYPQEMSLLNVFVFDQGNVLVGKQTFSDRQISKDHELFVPLKSEGLYSVVVWAGLDARFFDIDSPEMGKTTKQSIVASIRQAGKLAKEIDGQTLWMGSSEPILLGSMKDDPLQYHHTEVNMREFTNRITVSLTHAPDPQDYVIEMALSNGRYRYDGRISPCDSTYYPTKMNYSAPQDSTASAFFTTLKLESGRSNTLIVRNRKTGREVFREDLIGVILLSPSAANINLRCLNDFDVRLRMRKCDCPGGYMVAEIWINDWLVHSYDVTLDPNS